MQGVIRQDTRIETYWTLPVAYPENFPADVVMRIAFTDVRMATEFCERVRAMLQEDS